MIFRIKTRQHSIDSQNYYFNVFWFIVEGITRKIEEVMSKIKFNLTCHPIFVPFYGPDTGTVIARTVQNQQKDFKHVYNYPINSEAGLRKVFL